MKKYKGVRKWVIDAVESDERLARALFKIAKENSKRKKEDKK